MTVNSRRQQDRMDRDVADQTRVQGAGTTAARTPANASFAPADRVMRTERVEDTHDTAFGYVFDFDPAALEGPAPAPGGGDAGGFDYVIAKDRMQPRVYLEAVAIFAIVAAGYIYATVHFLG